MKFIIPLSLLLLTFPLLTPSTAAEPPPPLKIATFLADVTPPLGSPLCHGNVRPAEEIVDRLSARGIIFLTDQKPIVLCSVDWVGISNSAHDEFRQAIANAVDTTADRVSVHTVHQHDTPGIDFTTDAILVQHGLGGQMFDPVPARAAIVRTAQAAKKALASAHRVTDLGCGLGKVEKVASNRRILDADGRCIMTRMSSCRNEKAIAAPEGLIDPFVRLISFWDGDRPLASLTYYACHPQSHYGRGGVSYDFMGMARDLREEALPKVAHIHFNGAGGNLAAGKYNDGSPEMRPILADRLAAGMKAAWEATQETPVSAADVQWRVVPVQLPVRKNLIESELLEKVANQDLKAKDRIRSARELAWLRRMNAGHRIELGALRIGPARLLHMPGELCIEYQLAAQSFRKDAFVAMAAYADDGMCYICTEIAYSQGGYETGRASRVAPEVEGLLMGAIGEMLEVERK
jgi:hypothetical protein